MNKSLIKNQDDLETALEFLSKNDLISKHTVVVSIAASKSSFSFLSSHFRDKFKESVRKIADTINALFITGGEQNGVTKLTGEALKGSKSKLLSIVDSTQSESKKKVQFDDELDNSHSYFIFVKNEKNKKIKLRNLLEIKLSETLPIVLISVNGSVNTLEMVKSYISNKLPVMLIAGTGGITDDLTKILNEFDQFKLNGKTGGKILKEIPKLNKLIHGLEREKSTNNDQNVNKIIETYKNLETENVHYLNAYNFESTSNIEKIALKNLIKGQMNKSVETALYLTFEWNRADIAHEELFNFEINWNIQVLRNIMKKSIKLNKPNFVNLLLKNGFEIETLFPTSYILFSIGEGFYNFNKNKTIKEVPFDIYFKQEFANNNSENNFLISPSDIKYFIEEIILKTVETKNIFDGKKDPVVNLFIWCLLYNRFEIAKILLTKLQNQIGMCLMASMINKEFSTYFKLKDDHFIEQSKFFEKFSIELLNKYNTNYLNVNSTHQLLLSNELDYFRSHLIKISLNGKCKNFIASDMVQEVMENIWTHSLLLEPDRIIFYKRFAFLQKTLSYATLGLFAPLYQYFDLPEDLDDKKRVNLALRTINTDSRSFIMGKEIKNRSFLIRYKNFIQSPRSHFIYEKISFFVFLVLFNYMMLFNFGYDNNCSSSELSERNLSSLNKTSGNKSIKSVSRTEYLMCVWVFSFFLCELSQVRQKDEKKLEKKFQKYIFYKFNQFDLQGILMFALGMLLRFFSIYSNSSDLFEGARVVLSYTLFYYFYRISEIFFLSRKFSSKLIILKHMINEASYFTLFIIMFFLAQLAAILTLLKQNGLNASILDIFLDFVWRPFYADTEFIQTLKNSSTPSVNLFFACLLTISFVFSTNIVVTNLLIAMFNYHFERVQADSETLTKYEKLLIIYRYDEYSHSFPLPPPFNLLKIIFILKNMLITRKKQSKQFEMQTSDLAQLKETAYIFI